MRMWVCVCRETVVWCAGSLCMRAAVWLLATHITHTNTTRTTTQLTQHTHITHTHTQHTNKSNPAGDNEGNICAKSNRGWNSIWVMNLLLSVCTRAHRHTHTHTHTRTHTYKHAHTHTRAHVHTYARTPPHPAHGIRRMGERIWCGRGVKHTQTNKDKKKTKKATKANKTNKQTKQNTDAEQQTNKQTVNN